MKTNSVVKEENFIVKSNALVEARYRLSLQESQIILWLLTQIKPDDEDFKSHRLDITEFAELTKVNSENRYSELRRVTKQLMQRVIEIHSPKEQKTIQVAWLSSAEYRYKKGLVYLEFSPKLKPYLLQLKNHFTKINITDTLKLKSIYAVRIFELLLQYSSLGKREIRVDELRQYCGILEQEYQNYFDFKRNVLNRAETQINTKTDYEVDFKEIKESRKVVSIVWTIKKKKPLTEQAQKLIALEKELRSQESLIESLIEYGFSRAKAKHLLHTNRENIIQNALRAVNLQIKRGHAKNPKAMLRIAIQEQWHPEKFIQKKKP